MSRVSVVIRTYNEEQHLAHTLQAVLAQREVEPEIIVVDSGSTDRSRKIASSFPVKLLTLTKAEFSYGRALNIGFAAATAPWVANLSAHARPVDRHWLRNLVRPFTDPRIDGVMGKTLPHTNCNPFDRRGLLRHFGTDGCFLTESGGFSFSNANCVIRRSAWEEEPFDERLPYAEDLLWARRRLGLGRALAYAPDAVVYHSHNESLTQLSNRFWAESRAREIIDPHHPNYSIKSLAWDFAAGTGYDLWTVIASRADWRWLPFAPRRRLAMNLGRYAGSRTIVIRPGRSPWAIIGQRFALQLLRGAGRLAARLTPWLVVGTRKHRLPIHPKHLLGDRGDHFWYAAELRGGRRALDVGCNIGAHANYAAGQGLSVIGFDIDPLNLKRARTLLNLNRASSVMIVRASADQQFPFADGSFDRVLAFDIIEHLQRPDRMLAEIRRVLAPDGLLLLSAPNMETSWKRRYREAGLSFFADVGHQIEYTHGGLMERMGQAGFTVLREEPTVADTPLAPWYDLLGGLSLKLYARLVERKRRRALDHPSESTGFRLVARKVEH